MADKYEDALNPEKRRTLVRIAAANLVSQMTEPALIALQAAGKTLFVNRMRAAETSLGFTREEYAHMFDLIGRALRGEKLLPTLAPQFGRPKPTYLVPRG